MTTVDSTLFTPADFPNGHRFIDGASARLRTIRDWAWAILGHPGVEWVQIDDHQGERKVVFTIKGGDIDVIREALEPFREITLLIDWRSYEWEWED
jgi:hypothetical protein